jgi:hypothetical protein
LYQFIAKKDYTLPNCSIFPIHHQIIHVYRADTIDANYNTRDEIWRNSTPCGKITGQQRVFKLLDRFDPEDMTIQIGAKWIRITKHSAKCVLCLPSEGGDPPMMINDARKKILRDMAACIFLDQPSPKDTKINPK